MSCQEMVSNEGPKNSEEGISTKEKAYMARVAIKTGSVILTFKLTIRGRDSLVLDR
jgi:hypothetical protein